MGKAVEFFYFPLLIVEDATLRDWAGVRVSFVTYPGPASKVKRPPGHTGDILAPYSAGGLKFSGWVCSGVTDRPDL